MMFHSHRGPAPFFLTNVGKIAVFAFNTVNYACYFFFRWMVHRFFEDRSKCAYGRYPLNIAYHGKASRVRIVALWARPWLGRIYNEYGGISIDL